MQLRLPFGKGKKFGASRSQAQASTTSTRRGTRADGTVERRSRSSGGALVRRTTGAELDRMQLSRMSLVGTLLAGGFFAVAGMCIYLQGCEHEVLLEEAERNYLRTLRLDTQRGDIYDRSGEALATSVDVDTVYANPRKVTDPTGTAEKLSAALDLPADTVMKALTADAHFRYVKRQVTAEEAQRIRALELPGIMIQSEAKRFYPKKELAGQFLGVVGFDSNGVEGVEATYDQLLKGGVLEADYSRDSSGNYEMLEPLPAVETRAGHSLQLTIDEKIQDVAETELERAVVSFLGRSGMAVVMDVTTGDVLAAAHYPRFNPNRYLEIVGEDTSAYDQEQAARRAVRQNLKNNLPVDEDLYNALRMHSTVPRHRNRITAFSFEPGSTFKIVTLAAALEEGVVGLSDMIDTEGGRIKVDKKWVSDTHQFDRPLSVTELVKYSSNVGFIKVGNMLGKDLLYKYVTNFGFGSPTGLGVGGDYRGNVPSIDKWGKVVLSNISFGQGLAVTALQITTALAAIGNGGVLMKPRLVMAELDSERNILREFPPESVRRVVSPGTAKTVIKALESVVEYDGTGHEAWLYDYDVAGKTGTAQKVDPLVGGYSDEHWTASFIGLVPAKNPRLAIAVIVDEPKGLYYGGRVAAPAFHSIAEFALHYLGVPPSYGPRERVAREDVRRKHGQPDLAAEGVFYDAGEAKNPAVNPSEPDQVVVPDFTDMGIRGAVEQAHRDFLVVDVDGSGSASAQSIPAGTHVPAWTKITIYFRPGDEGAEESR